MLSFYLKLIGGGSYYINEKNSTQYSYTGMQVFGYKKTPDTVEVTGVCKQIEICDWHVIMILKNKCDQNHTSVVLLVKGGC